MRDNGSEPCDSDCVWAKGAKRCLLEVMHMKSPSYFCGVCALCFGGAAVHADGRSQSKSAIIAGKGRDCYRICRRKLRRDRERLVPAQARSPRWDRCSGRSLSICHLTQISGCHC